MWCSSNAGRAVGYNGVTVLTAEGKLIGRIRLLEVTANVCFEYLQSWDVPNVFVVGASAFPQISSFNPTGTVSALAYLTADAIEPKYLKIRDR